MEIQCPKCGETCAIDFEPEVGQHIVCPFCNQKFSYGEPQKQSPKNIMAVCPYCGFAEPVDEQFSGRVGECSQCHGEFTIMPNARGIPFQPQTVAAQQSSGRSEGSSSDGVLGFLLGLILGIFGVLLAVLIDKKRYLKSSLYGLLANIVVSILLVVVFTGISRDIGRKAAGATEALSDEEGANARKAVEAIDRDRLRSFDE